MKLYVYPALVFEKDELHFVYFPDLDLRAVDDTDEEAFLKAKEYLKGYFKLSTKFGSSAPSPSSYDEVCKRNPNNKVVMVDVSVEESTEETEADKKYKRFRKMFFED